MVAAGTSVLVTGGAGFIGSRLCGRLLASGYEVTALDSFDDFYESWRKEANVRALLDEPGFRLVRADVRDAIAVADAMPGIDAVVHLAARAGVRPSFAAAALYCDVNVTGTAVLLQAAADAGVARFVLASSSSVYGEGADRPFREDGAIGTPMSPYATTKLSAEHLCRTYLPRIAHVAALRLFSVYGPGQRPDLAIHTFAERIVTGEPIPVFGSLQSFRDYTFVDDIADGIAATLQTPEPWLVANLGSGRPLTLGEMIESLETALGTAAIKDMQPPARGDLFGTWADISRARELLGYRPQTTFATGVRAFVKWFLDTPDASAARSLNAAAEV